MNSLVLHHDTPIKELSKPTGSVVSPITRFACDRCKRRFEKKVGLSIHQRSCMVVKQKLPCKYSTCPFTALSVAGLKNHERVCSHGKHNTIKCDKSVSSVRMEKTTAQHFHSHPSHDFRSHDTPYWRSDEVHTLVDTHTQFTTKTSTPRDGRYDITQFSFSTDSEISFTPPQFRSSPVRCRRDFRVVRDSDLGVDCTPSRVKVDHSDSEISFTPPRVKDFSDYDAFSGIRSQPVVELFSTPPRVFIEEPDSEISFTPPRKLLYGDSIVEDISDFGGGIDFRAADRTDVNITDSSTPFVTASESGLFEVDYTASQTSSDRPFPYHYPEDTYTTAYDTSRRLISDDNDTVFIGTDSSVPGADWVTEDIVSPHPGEWITSTSDTVGSLDGDKVLCIDEALEPSLSPISRFVQRGREEAENQAKTIGIIDSRQLSGCLVDKGFPTSSGSSQETREVIEAGSCWCWTRA